MRGGSGTDTLRLDGSGHLLDLTAIADNRLVDIEAIDLTGSGPNSMVLNRLEVVNLSSTSNTLRIDGSEGDWVTLGEGWIRGTDQTNGGATYRVYTQGSATLLVDGRVQLHPVALSTLDGTNGFRLDGIDAYDFSGNAVSSAGDVNGDGFDDLIIASGSENPGGNSAAGETYVVFGKATGFPAGLDLADLDGTNGFRLEGIDLHHYRDAAVSAAGDVNGDGFDDLIVGANGSDPAGRSNAGATYVVFGKASGFTAVLHVSSLDGTSGFRLDGVAPGHQSGYSVSSAGDVNGDGFDDLIIGAPYASPGGDSRAGETYVIFGRATGFAAVFELSALDGTNGFRLQGIDPRDHAGFTLSSAGDVNGDGFDDLIIGSRGAELGVGYAGETYVVFGKARGFTAALDLSTLDGTNGFRLEGGDPRYGSRQSVSSAGDVNGDGFDDLIIGAADFRSGGETSGITYVVFGKFSGFGATLELSALDGAKGFRLGGIDSDDNSGGSVSSAGDVNGDGFDDLLIGAIGGDPGGVVIAGETYVVFGKPNGFAADFDLSTLDGRNGFRLDGIHAFDTSGSSVSSAGDVNGDGFDDLIIGAPRADPGGHSSAGETYVVFGGNFTDAVTHGGDTGGDTLLGHDVAEVLFGRQGNDVLVGNGGSDVLNGGHGDDVLVVSDLTFQKVRGGSGTDTLRLDGAGLHLDLSAIPDSRIVDIEAITFSGARGNTLSLNSREVLNLSSTSNQVRVRGGNDDRVNLGEGWTREANQTLGSTTYRVYSQGQATVLVSASIGVVVVDGTAWLYGTDGADSFSIQTFDFQQRRESVVTMNGRTHAFRNSDVSVVRAIAGAGNDTLVVVGTGGDDTATLRPGTLDYFGAALDVRGRDVERIEVSSGGGNDMATLVDSTGDDFYAGTPAESTLSGAGFENTVRGFPRVDTYGRAGGFDWALLSDSADDDVFRGRPTVSFLVSPAATNYARGFEQVEALAFLPGDDQAFLYGSSGNETFLAEADAQTLVGAGFSYSTRGFSRIEALSFGGDDSAVFTDSAGDDRYRAESTVAFLIAPTHTHVARGFARTEAGSHHGGDDRALLFDSSGDDTYRSTLGRATFAGTGFENTAVGFARVDAFASSGQDVGIFEDAVNGDLLSSGTADRARLRRAGGVESLFDFDRVEAHSRTGEASRSTLDPAAVDYEFELFGTWI